MSDPSPHGSSGSAEPSGSGPDPDDQWSVVGDQIAAVLRAAQEAASKARDRAEAEVLRQLGAERQKAERDVADLLTDARAEAQQLRADARADAERIRNRAQGDAARIRDAARHQAEQVVAEADEYAATRVRESDRRVRDADEALTAARAQADALVEQARVRQQELLGALSRGEEGLRQQLTDTIDVLQGMLEELQRAASGITIDLTALAPHLRVVEGAEAAPEADTPSERAASAPAAHDADDELPPPPPPPPPSGPRLTSGERLGPATARALISDFRRQQR
ncbi:MAG: hypothetical protein MUF83_14785 [Acidimicrobiales bacterium]|nr:hypothetical protein [Acidimicrobiales bacterium]